jgi:hypothetical protein
MRRLSEQDQRYVQARLAEIRDAAESLIVGR